MKRAHEREADRLRGDILAAFNATPGSTMDGRNMSAELSRCISESFARLFPARRKRTVAEKATKAAKVGKRQAKREKTRDVRAAVMLRSLGRCDCCGEMFGFGLGEATMDHFWGRARAESLETCWALCARCHHQKTNNIPDATRWLRVFAIHAERYGYVVEALKAHARIATLEQKFGGVSR